ncbi:DUF547 domain-containing protein [Sungkyunkwania multivorans]|uniref:DUF547 domain-containing protein n=1 Tax=Sungkyunkwania multivorans TaxID=1173618 RepID=A0ABW3D2N6_9FLAO
MKSYRSLLLLLLLGKVGLSQDVETFFDQTNTFLKTHVSNGKVDYAAISQNMEGIKEILVLASKVRVSKDDPTTYQAFWINAYNLSVIKGIASKYPIKSPLDITGFFDKTTYDLAGTSITLNDIENKNLRGNFDDARFHFVLVCAGLGCPPIIKDAYLPSTLDAQLTEQTRKAINDPNFIQVNDKRKRVAFSQIMEWYNEDFTKNGQSLIEYANQYRVQKIPSDYKTSFYEYDWRLNSK